MRCSFCGEDIARGTGMIVSLKDGSLVQFCSSKCERNLMHLGRKPQETKWTRRYLEEKAVRIEGKKEKKAKVIHTAEEGYLTKKAKAPKKARQEERLAKKTAAKAEKKAKKGKPKAAAPAAPKAE